MKINRLTEIILILSKKRSITAKELADKFEVSTRTIYRDIETLSLSGVPVYMNKGKGGGISLLEGYSIDKTFLSENDKQGLMVALNALSSIQYPKINSLINKVGYSYERDDINDFIEIDFSRWGSNSHVDDKFIDIKSAILNNKVIKFKYTNSYLGESTREVEPMKLIYKGQTWYLQGYCKEKEDIRIFRISRIKELSITEEEFIKRYIEWFLNDSIEKKSPNLVSIKLRAKKEILYRMLDEVDKESIKDNQNGTYDICLELPESEWLYGYILSFGNSIEVLEPIDIRKIIINKTKEILDNYK